MLLLPELIDGSCPDPGLANYYHNNSLSLCFLSTRILWHQCHAEQPSAGLAKYQFFHSSIQIFILHMQDNMHGYTWRGDNFTPLNKMKFSVRSCYAMELQLNECFCGVMDSLCVCLFFPWGDICVWHISMCVCGYTCKDTHVCRHTCGGEDTWAWEQSPEVDTEHLLIITILVSKPEACHSASLTG